MKADIYNLEGKSAKKLDLPIQFNEPVRLDLIKRAVISLQLSRRTPYGAYPEAGKRQSAKLSRRRRKYKGSYGRGISRSPRKVLTKRGTQFYYVGAVAPNTVGGRRAHPPKAEKNWYKKINNKERRKAIRSALAATADLDLVKTRGHKIDRLTLIVDSKIENISKTNEIKKILLSLGLEKELNRIEAKKIRAGKGKLRGRKYKKKKGPLIVVSKPCNLIKAAGNLQGIDICEIKNINTELLAPGTIPGRFTIFSEEAIKELEEKKLFLK